jgi:hypothetical protein
LSELNGLGKWRYIGANGASLDYRCILSTTIQPTSRLRILSGFQVPSSGHAQIKKDNAMKFIRNKFAPIPDYNSETHRIWKSCSGMWKIRRNGSTELVDAERANMREAKLYCERELTGGNWSENREAA